MNPTIAVVFIVLMAVLVSLIGLLLVRRLAPIEQLAQHTDVAGYVYAVIGVIYAVVLALVVIAAWEEYRDAREVVANEASAVLNMARAANGWPAGDRDRVETALTAYARHVVDVEWPAMARGDFGPTTDTVIVNQLWQAPNEADESASAKSVSAVVTVGFAYLFAVDSGRLHALMITSLAVLVTLLLPLQFQLGMSFQGSRR